MPTLTKTRSQTDSHTQQPQYQRQISTFPSISYYTILYHTLPYYTHTHPFSAPPPNSPKTPRSKTQRPQNVHYIPPPFSSTKKKKPPTQHRPTPHAGTFRSSPPIDIRQRRPQHVRPRLLHLGRADHVQDAQAVPRVLPRGLEQGVARGTRAVVHRGGEGLFLGAEDAGH